MFDTMFNDLFIESAFEDDNAGCTLHTDASGFVSADIEIDESYVVDKDPFAFITEAMLQNVVNANNISLAIMADRYKYLKENGVEVSMVTEAANAEKSGIGAKIKAFFKAVKEKIKKFFQTVLAKLKALQDKIRSKFTKNKKAAAATAAITATGEVQVPAYMPDTVYFWAQKQFNAIVDGNNPEPFPYKNKTTSTTPAKENTVLGTFGKFVDNVKKLETAALKTLDTMEKDTVKGLTSSAEDKALKKDVHQSYAAWANSVTALSKEAVGYIMTRLSAAQKALGKKTVSESFIDNLEMI